MKLISRTLAAVSMAAPVLAFAEVPAAVTTAVTGAGTDGLTLVGALAAAGATVFIIHKLLKRFGISL